MSNQLITHAYSGGTVTNSAYTSIGLTTVNTNKILVSDSSGAMMKLAYGAAGSQIDLFQLPISGMALLSVPSSSTLPIGTNLWLKSIDTASVATGTNAVTLLS